MPQLRRGRSLHILAENYAEPIIAYMTVPIVSIEEAMTFPVPHFR